MTLSQVTLCALPKLAPGPNMPSPSSPPGKAPLDHHLLWTSPEAVSGRLGFTLLFAAGSQHASTTHTTTCFPFPGLCLPGFPAGLSCLLRLLLWVSPLPCFIFSSSTIASWHHLPKKWCALQSFCQSCSEETQTKTVSPPWQHSSPLKKKSHSRCLVNSQYERLKLVSHKINNLSI